jgi:group I intron endonuclease
MIQNVINKKIYIGQTTMSPMSRWKDHWIVSQTGRCNNELYSDMRLQGLTDFIFQVLETKIDEKNLDAREMFYIDKFQSNICGYNVTIGGNHTSAKMKLNADIAKEIIDAITSGIPFKNIAEIYHIDRSTVSDINNGDTWHFDDIVYPIMKSNYDKKNFSEKDIDDIYALLRDNYTAKSIGKMYDTSTTTISKINNGLIYARESETYPINKASTRPINLKPNEVVDVAKSLEDKTENYVSLARKLHIGRKTISGINNGTLYRNVLEKAGYTQFPIRK